MDNLQDQSPEAIAARIRVLGCGHRQPVIRREGLRLYASFKHTPSNSLTPEVPMPVLLNFLSTLFLFSFRSGRTATLPPPPTTRAKHT